MADEPTVPRPRPRAKGGAKKAASPTEPTGATDTGNDSPPADTPPRGRARAAASNSLEAKLTDFIAIGAIPFSAMGDDYSAQIIASRAPILAKALDGLAKENASIRRTLNKMLEGSAWGGVALAAAAILIPLAQNQGVIPGSDPFQMMFPGPPPPNRGGTTQTPIAAPPVGFEGWSVQTPPAAQVPDPPAAGGTPTAAVSVMPGNDEAVNPLTGEPIPQYLDGAPPGVVTVAATGAGHPGAR